MPFLAEFSLPALKFPEVLYSNRILATHREYRRDSGRRVLILCELKHHKAHIDDAQDFAGEE